MKFPILWIPGAFNAAYTKNDMHAYATEAVEINCSALTARVAELEAALKPFALELKEWDSNYPDSYAPQICAGDEIPADAKFTLGDLRRAAALLAKGE